MLRRRRRERTGLLGTGIRWLRRIQRVVLVASIVAGFYRWWQQNGPGRLGGGGGGSGRPAPIGGPSAPSALRAAATPPREPELVGATNAPRATVAPPAGSPKASVEATAWVEPLDGGGCPAGYPVKANDSSRIYHVPGGRFYDRTVAVRCYSSPDAAAADGYRPAKA